MVRKHTLHRGNELLFLLRNRRKISLIKGNYGEAERRKKKMRYMRKQEKYDQTAVTQIVFNAAQSRVSAMWPSLA